MKFYKINIILKLLKDVKDIDKKYYAILWVILNFIEEDEWIYENITISPLNKIKWNEFSVDISMFSEEIYERFFKFLKNRIWEDISIDWLPFKFVWFWISDKWLIFDIEQELFSEQKEIVHWIKINFLSPTVVKSTPIYKLLPIWENYIYSLMWKYESILWKDNFFKYFWFNNTQKVKTLIGELLLESSYNLKTEKIFIKGWYVPWNIWRISYSINKSFKDPVAKELLTKLPIIIKWARWTWLWFWTRLWLWQIEWEVY